MKQSLSLRALRPCVAALALAAPLAASAAQFFVVVPSQGRHGLIPPEAEVIVRLNPGTLAIAELGRPYSQDMTGFLSVTGDPDFHLNNTTWSANENLPIGLTMTSAGLITGTPSVAAADVEFQVLAQYRERSAPMRYTITVKGLSLEVTKVVAGGAFSCALTPDGAVYCWGLNGSGQLGDGTRNQSDRPVRVAGIDGGATDIAVGTFHACAIVRGRAECWGDNSSGQLGSGSTNIDELRPTLVTNFGAVSALALGPDFSCGVGGGSAYCWGRNVDGQLGAGAPPGNSNTPIRIDSLEYGITGIAAGAAHVCAIQWGAALCWGSNYDGRLGIGTNAPARHTLPQQVIGVASGVTAIDSDPTGAHTCAIQGDAAKCWGANSTGALGIGNTQFAMVPVVVGLAGKIDQISAGGTHTCATVAGAAYCWGEGANGRLGSGNTAVATRPVRVQSLDGAVSFLDAGPYHTCAAHRGIAMCWGVGSVGRLGVGGQDDVLTPRPVAR